ARQLGVQPRARIAPRDRREGLPCQPRRAGDAAHRREQRERATVLHGGNRVLLAAEPARTLHGDGEVRRERIRESSVSVTRYFATFLPSTSSTGISRPKRCSSAGSVEMSISSSVSATRRATRATTVFISSHK